MNTVRSSTWINVLTLAFIINFYKVICFETTLNKQKIFNNEIQKKTSKNLLASLGLHQDTITTEVKAMKMTDAPFILDVNNKTTSGNANRTLQLERSRHPSAVHDIPVHEKYELKRTDTILNLVNYVRRSAIQVEENKRCQRLPLDIKFADIAMTWIQRPTHYNAYYCAGECNHPLVGDNVANHAKFQTRAAHSCSEERSIGRTKLTRCSGSFSRRQHRHLLAKRRSRHPSAVHDIPVHEMNESKRTDAILNLANNVRRSAIQVEEKKRCQRLPLNIKFADIAMTWIQRPTHYNAYYCAGECNHPLVGDNVANHAKFQSMYHFYKPDAVRDPCCVPTELSDLEIMYLVGRKETRMTMKDMVVEKCGCR
ncbi:hypothetical protein CHS0354_003891 [Potamilus streckersoni]|uniref:TGF-beta family profile domain-containing protein n=1 Tax=Potamilus streckersoni TaxID=2493646 RepID=A0AAE0TEM9_9BIVA|nr:hypothetical protein CHS0354_003891 [Potamilus streckersoni]